MSRIYWDSMLFIYWIEDHPQYGPRVDELLEKMDRRGDQLCTSVFTVGELLVGPQKRGQAEIVDRIREVLFSPNVELLPFTSETADRYARIRAEFGVSPADSIHLACASLGRINLFLTNDHRLRNLPVPGVDFVAGLDVNLF